MPAVMTQTEPDLHDRFRSYLEDQCGYLDVRFYDDGRYSAIMPLMFTHAIIVGPTGGMNCYMDRWCYGGLDKARRAHNEWDGTGEPEGWHRHPMSGRRREIDEETSRILGEYVDP